MTMAAHVGTHAPRSNTLIVRFKAFTGRLELDRRLASGERPDACPELARRASVIDRWRIRHHLADSLERLIVEAVAPQHEHGAAVPVQRDEVLMAQADLIRLVRALRSEPAPPLRCIAIVSLLLSDGAGPVSAPHPRGTLAEIAFRAAFLAEAG
jgi:hypothetical protein